MDLTFTPYSGLTSLFRPGDMPNWLPEDQQGRIASYLKYEEMYWSDEGAFRQLTRTIDRKPIVVPTARTLVNSTAHYLLKGMEITPDTIEGSTKVGDDVKQIFTSWLKREKFMSRFHTNKLCGVARGDFVLHMIGDPDDDEGERVSLRDIDPGSYFPITLEDDPDKIIGVNIVDQILCDDRKYRIKMLTYRKGGYEGSDAPKGRVERYERIYEADNSLFSGQPKIYKVTLQPELLPEGISAIPVYHFKNIDWQGWPFGASEVKGLERVMQAINQGATDEELTLALEGLGVWVTDGGHPVDKNGNDVDWVIAPAKVMEVPSGAFFKRAEGISSLTPFQQHMDWLEERTHEAAGNFRAGQVDPQTAISGIALAIKFLPMTAKLEQRDIAGVDLLQHLFFDWSFFHAAYESEDFSGLEVAITLGKKLPEDDTATLNALNNLVDRKAISREFYRDEVGKIYGFVYPPNMDAQIKSEKEADIEMQRQTALVTASADPLSSGGKPENKSNNKGKPNESGGQEAPARSANGSGRPGE